jgi:hypothetical protein
MYFNSCRFDATAGVCRSECLKLLTQLRAIKIISFFSIVSNFNHSEQKARILLRATSGGKPPPALSVVTNVKISGGASRCSVKGRRRLRS